MADNQNVQALADGFFEAIDILTSKRLSALEFDKTLVCTIESVEDAKNGAYKVTDGVSHFTAYSENVEYKVNTKVYVQIPNGDMMNQKIITGKYVTKDNEYITYTSPLNTFVDVTENLIDQNHYLALQANGDIKKSVAVIWEVPEYDKEGNILTPCSFKGYTRLGLKGEFKTYLEDSTRSGSYGLRLDIAERTESGLTKLHCFYLDSNDMYGNPYKYSTYFAQEQIYDISKIFEIISMRLVFYQKGDFFTENGTLLPVVEGKDNLFLQSPYVSLGYDMSGFSEDTVLLGTHDSLTYSTEIKPPERKAYMRWIHDKDGKFYSLDNSNETPAHAIIRWYDYKLEQGRKDDLAGYFWKEIENIEDKYNYTFIPDNNFSENPLKVIIEYPSREYVTTVLETNSSIRSLVQDILKAGGGTVLENSIYNLYTITDSEILNEEYNRIKALYATDNEEINTALTEIYNIIIETRASTKFYESEVLRFTNEISQTDEAVDLVQSLSIQVDTENQEGVYRLYDSTNHIINNSEATKMRSFKAQYNSVITGKQELDSAEEIIWYIPISNTMIHEPVEGKEYSLEDDDVFLNEEECGRPGYVAIKRYGTDTSDEIEEGIRLIEIEQKFRIKDYYTQTAGNNIVYCQIKKRERVYETSALLLFGTAGSNGTEATFLLKMYSHDEKKEPVDEVSAITYGGSVVIVPELYDYNNEQIGMSNITYRWKEFYGQDGGITLSKMANNNCLITSNPEKSLSEHRFYILEATTKWTDVGAIDGEGNPNERTIELTAFLPIAVRLNDTFVEIEGATQIIYDNNGVNPAYYKNPYKLFGPNRSVYSPIWSCHSPDFDRNLSSIKFYPTITESGSFMPTKMYYSDMKSYCVLAFAESAQTNTDYVETIDALSDNKNNLQSKTAEKKILEDSLKEKRVDLSEVIKILAELGDRPNLTQKTETELASMTEEARQQYEEDWDRQTAIDNETTLRNTLLEEIEDLEDSIDALEVEMNSLSTDIADLQAHLLNNYTSWIQPILISQNRYSSAMLNGWNGDLTIDEKNGTILSAMVGAGIKNDDNTFSGVLMGEVGKALENNSIGLYGFDHGDQSYGFKVDGTAFLGKSGKGRITFDGNKGTITSGNYIEPIGSSTGAGMKIDLDDSLINIYGDAGYIKMNAGNSRNLFNITSASGTALINISDGEGNYYIQSDNFNSSADIGITQGMKININKGILEAVGADEEGRRTGDIRISAGGDPYFRIRTVYPAYKEDEPEGTVHENKNLIYVSKKDLYLQSADYKIRTSTEFGAGTKIDLAEGKITSYNFTINAYGKYIGKNQEGQDEEKTGVLNIDSTQDTYPLNVNDRFKVDWGGNVISNYITATGGTLGGWYIDNNGIYDYNPESLSEGETRKGMALLSRGEKGATSGSDASKLRIAVGTFTTKSFTGTDADDENNSYTSLVADGTGFSVYSNGVMKCYGSTMYSANINTATIDNATITNSTITKAKITSGTITNASISKGTITNATINSATITGNCTVSGTLNGGTITGATITAKGYVTCSGLTVGGKEYAPYTIDKTFVTCEETSGWAVLNTATTFSGAPVHTSTDSNTDYSGTITAYGTTDSGEGVTVSVPTHRHGFSYSKTTDVSVVRTPGSDYTALKRYTLTFDVIGTVKEG